MYQIDNSTAVAAQPPSTAAGNAGYFTDGNIAAAQPPTIFPAEFANMLMLEILNAVKAAGIVPDKTKFNQLALAIGGGRTSYGHDSGVANAYALALGQAPAALLDGMVVCFLAANPNTGASTLNLNGMGAQPILGTGHTALKGGEIVANGFVRVQWNVALASWVILDNTGGIQQGVTAPQFDAGPMLATDAFVQRALGNFSQAGFINANTVLTAASAGQVIVLGGTGSLTATLPALAAVQRGTAFSFMSGTGAAWTLACSGSDKFAPNSFTYSTMALGAGDCVTVVSDGSFWRPVSGASQLQYSATFGASLGAAGYQKLPGGLIFQWGAFNTVATGYSTVTYPIAFPNGMKSLSACITNSNATLGGAMYNQGGSPTTSFVLASASSANAYSAQSVTWMATGF